MKEKKILEDSTTYRAQLDAAAGALQVALIYQDELNQDYSRAIEGLNAVANGAYRMGRDTLEDIRDEGAMYANPVRPHSDNILRGQNSEAEWIMLEDAGNVKQVLKTHLKRIEESEEGLGTGTSGTRLRESLELYEELVEAANEYEICNLEPIDDPLKDESLGEKLREDEDAVVF